MRWPGPGRLAASGTIADSVSLVVELSIENANWHSFALQELQNKNSNYTSPAEKVKSESFLKVNRYAALNGPNENTQL